MSEYQYHEWQTVERVLTPEEQSEGEICQPAYADPQVEEPGLGVR